jgi:hypothetical protein
MSDLHGHEYVALRRLTDRSGRVLAAVGDRCARVAPSSLPILLADGDIVLAPSETSSQIATSASMAISTIEPPAATVDDAKDGEA